jgi:hypothetical protein
MLQVGQRQNRRVHVLPDVHVLRAEQRLNALEFLSSSSIEPKHFTKPVVSFHLCRPWHGRFWPAARTLLCPPLLQVTHTHQLDFG